MVLLGIMESHFSPSTKKGIIAKGLCGEEKNSLEGTVLEFWNCIHYLFALECYSL